MFVYFLVILSPEIIVTSAQNTIKQVIRLKAFKTWEFYAIGYLYNMIFDCFSTFYSMIESVKLINQQEHM